MRVLIVEDDEPLALGLAGILKGQGIDSAVSAHGEDALRAVREDRFDLMILDIGIPLLDGFGVLEALRKSSNPLPVLVLTARDMIEDRVRGLDLGADDYMVKPFALPELTARVRALLRRAQAQSAGKIVNGPLLLDRAGHRAYLAGEPLELRLREWIILDHLTSRVGRIVSKQSLLETINGQSGLSVNAVEVYVSRLRAKLQAAEIVVRTVRGLGYMMEEFKKGSIET